MCLEVVKWRQETPLSGAKIDKKVAKKDDKKVAKKDDKKVAKKTTIVLIIIFFYEKDSPLLSCLFVYSLIQKRERVAHCLSVFYIEIFDFDSFDMIIKFPCKKYKYFWKDCVY